MIGLVENKNMGGLCLAHGIFGGLLSGSPALPVHVQLHPLGALSPLVASHPTDSPCSHLTQKTKGLTRDYREHLVKPAQL